jgi:hypothetical protein
VNLEFLKDILVSKSFGDKSVVWIWKIVRIHVHRY